MDIQFIDPVPDILEEVTKATGKRIEFIQKDDLPTYAALKMARKNTMKLLTTLSFMNADISSESSDARKTGGWFPTAPTN